MLLRKIASKGRWNKSKIPDLITRDDRLFTGDAISDLRTKSNTISVWHTPDLDDANLKPILATMALNCDKIDKIFFVALDESELIAKGLLFKPVRGLSNSVVDLNILDRHRDIYEVDYWHLGILAEYIYKLIEENKVYSKTKTTLETWAKELISSKQADPDKMNNEIRQALGYAPVIAPPFDECKSCQLFVNP